MGLGVLAAAALTLWAWPTPRAAAVNPQACERKRVDPCGCHHLYGLRHCHPNRKGPHCELPVRSVDRGRVEPAVQR